MATSNPAASEQVQAARSSFFDFTPRPDHHPLEAERIDSPVHMQSGGQNSSSQGAQTSLGSNNPYFQRQSRDALDSSQEMGLPYNRPPVAAASDGNSAQSSLQDLFSALNPDLSTLKSAPSSKDRSSPAKRTSNFFPKLQEKTNESSDTTPIQTTLVDVSLPPSTATNPPTGPLFANSSSATHPLEGSAESSPSTSSFLGKGWSRESTLSKKDDSDLATLGSSGILDSVDDLQSPPPGFPGNRVGHPGMGRQNSGSAGVIGRPSSLENGKGTAGLENVSTMAADFDRDSLTNGASPALMGKTQTPISRASSSSTATGANHTYGPQPINQALPTKSVQHRSPAVNNTSSVGSSPLNSESFRSSPLNTEYEHRPIMDLPTPADTPLFMRDIPPPAPSVPPAPEPSQTPAFIRSARDGNAYGAVRNPGANTMAMIANRMNARRMGNIVGDNRGLVGLAGSRGIMPQQQPGILDSGVSINQGAFGRGNDMRYAERDQLAGLSSGRSASIRIPSSSHMLPRPPTIDPMSGDRRYTYTGNPSLNSLSEDTPAESDLLLHNNAISAIGAGAGPGLGLSSNESPVDQYSPRRNNRQGQRQNQIAPQQSFGTRESVMRGQFFGSTSAIPTNNTGASSPGGVYLAQIQVPAPTGRERSESGGYPIYNLPTHQYPQINQRLPNNQTQHQQSSDISAVQAQYHLIEEQQQRLKMRQSSMPQQAINSAKMPHRSFSFEDPPVPGSGRSSLKQDQPAYPQPTVDHQTSFMDPTAGRNNLENSELSNSEHAATQPQTSGRKATEDDAIASLADLYPTLPTDYIQSLHSFALYLGEDASAAERGEKLKAAQAGESRLSAIGISRVRRWEEWKEKQGNERSRVIAIHSPGIAISSSQRRSTGVDSERSSSGMSVEDSKANATRHFEEKVEAKGGSSNKTTPSTTPNLANNPFHADRDSSTPTEYGGAQKLHPLPAPHARQAQHSDATDSISSSQPSLEDGDDEDEDDDDDDSDTREFYPSRRQREAAAKANSKSKSSTDEIEQQAGKQDDARTPSPTPTDLQVAAAPKVDLELQMPRPVPSVPAMRIDPSARRKMIDEESSIAGTESRASTRDGDESGKGTNIDTRQLIAVAGAFSRRGNMQSANRQAEIPPLLRQAYNALEIATNNPSLDHFLSEARRVLETKTSQAMNVYQKESQARRQRNQNNAAALMSTGRFTYTDIERMGEDFEKEEARRRIDADNEVYLLFEKTFVEVSYKEVKSQLEVLGRRWYEDVKNWLFRAVEQIAGNPGQSAATSATDYHLLLESIDLLNKLHLTMEDHEQVLQNLVSERNARYLQISIAPVLAAGDTTRSGEADRRYLIDEQERQIVARTEMVKRAKEHLSTIERIDSKLVEGLKRRWDEVIHEVNAVIFQFPGQVLPEVFRRLDYDFEGKKIVPIMEEGFVVPPSVIASLGDSVQTLSEIVNLVKLALDFQNEPQLKLCEADCSLHVIEDHFRIKGLTSPTATAAAMTSGLATRLPIALRRLQEEQAQRSSAAQDDLLDVLRKLRSMVAAFETCPSLPAVSVRPPAGAIVGSHGQNEQMQLQFQQHQHQQQQQQQQQHQIQMQQMQQVGVGGVLPWMTPVNPSAQIYEDSVESPQFSPAGGADIRWGNVNQGRPSERMPNLHSVIGSLRAVPGNVNMSAPSGHPAGFVQQVGNPGNNNGAATGGAGWGPNPSY
ncbi:MAG: hypothetical protein M1829_006186 [Trizodia sp. TS-e1964]|nr:MAG: hypothetical protein M1829_006186 [Trizodia sp. TS-e1964]